MEQEINIDYTNLLTQLEYNQLQVFNRLKDFNKKYKEFILKNKNFKKNDVLWAIYNDARLEYEYKKDITMLSVVFDRQSDILISDRKYNQALQTFSASLYMILYDYEHSTKVFNLFDLHLNKRRKEKLKKLLAKTQTSLNIFENEFHINIQDIIPNFFDKNKADVIIKNIIERIK